MKTAMQELIEKLDYSIENSKDDFKIHFSWIKFHAELLLQKEKEQLIDAYDEGLISGEANEEGNGRMFFNLFYKKNKCE